MAYEWDAPESASGLYVNINGETVPAEKATVSVFDRGVLYGDAVFDSFPVYGGKVVLLDRHIDRLYRSAKAVKIDLTESKDEIKRRVIETLEAGGVEDGSVRVIVTRGAGPTGLVNTDQLEEPTILVLTSRRLEETFSKDEVTTTKARLAATRTIPPDSLDRKIKTTNYLSNALAERELVGTDADFSIMLNHDGTVAEAYAANVFVRDDAGVFRTPPVRNVLGGLTREVVIETARNLDYEVEETDLTQYDLYTADDVFLTSSGLGISFVEELDGQTVGDGEPSDALLDLADSFFEYVNTEEYVELDV